MDDGESVERGLPARLDGVPLLTAAGVAHRARRVAQLPAARAALDRQTVAFRDLLPPPAVVVPHRRLDPGRLLRHGRFATAVARLLRRPAVRGLEAQDAEAHVAEVFAVLVREGGLRRDEVPDACAGRLLLGDRVDDGERRDLLAELQVAGVVLLGVGTEDARVAVVIEELVEAMLPFLGSS